MAALAREERLQARFAPKAAAPVVPKAAHVSAPPAPLSIRLSRERLSVFATLATIEARPLEEVIAECLADMAAHLTRTRHALRLDPQDQQALDAYLDSLAAQQERAEWEDEDAAARAATTPAMRAAAVAGDAREAFPMDDEQADFLHRCQGAGYVEIELAMNA